MMSLSVGIHGQLTHIFIAFKASDESKDEPENVAYYETVSVLWKRIAAWRLGKIILCMISFTEMSNKIIRVIAFILFAPGS